MVSCCFERDWFNFHVALKLALSSDHDFQFKGSTELEL